MLPKALFERISLAFGLKTSLGARERRQGVRVDLRCKAYVCTVVSGRAGPAALVRLREMSQSGMSMVHPVRIRVGQELLVRVNGRDGHRFWIWTRCRRCHAADHLCNLVGVVFTRVLLPGQDIRSGTDLERLTWLNVEGDAVTEDPFASVA